MLVHSKRSNLAFNLYIFSDASTPKLIAKKNEHIFCPVNDEHFFVPDSGDIAFVTYEKGEAEANNRLVEAGDSLGVVSLHLRYLQTMIRINQPPNVNHGYILPFPLEMLRLKKSFVNSGYDLVDQLIKGMNLKLMETVDNDLTNNPEAKTKKRRKRRKNNED